MPEEIHKWLINFEGADVSATTTIDALMAKLEQLRASIRQTADELGKMGQQTRAGFVDPFGGERTQPPPPRRTRTWEEQMAARFEKIGASQDYASQVMQRYNELLETGIPKASAFSMAQREVTKSLLGTGEAAQKSGGWLGSYIQRYLIRYLVVWQGMVAVKAVIRDWAQAHEELDRTMFRLQTTMGLTANQAERYMAAMKGVSGISGVQMAGGAMQLGPTGAGMAGQFGAMTGIGAGEGMGFFAGIKRQYDLTNAEIERLIPRMFAAFARSGQDIQSFMKDWEAMLAQFDAGSMAISEWTRAAEIYETTGMRATERVSAEYQDFLSVLGDTTAITSAKNAIANLFAFLTENVALIDFALKTSPLTSLFYQAMEMGAGGGAITLGPVTAHEQWRLTGERPDAGQFGIRGFAGRMTGAEAERYEDLIQKWDAYFESQGRNLTEQTITLVTEIGEPLKMIQGSAEASKLALEEMNERQKTAVYNWPGDVASISMGVQAMSQTRISREPSTSAAQPGGAPAIDWGADPNYWYYIPGVSPWSQYQHGGVVPGPIGQPQTAIVHGGETITPPGQAGTSDYHIHVHQYLEGKQIAETTSRIQGNQLWQAQRATAGLPGGLLSM